MTVRRDGLREDLQTYTSVDEVLSVCGPQERHASDGGGGEDADALEVTAIMASRVTEEAEASWG